MGSETPALAGGARCAGVELVAWMLDRGRREAVPGYLRRVQELVPEFRDRLAGRAADIEKRLTPDFQDRELLAEDLKVAVTRVARPAT